MKTWFEMKENGDNSADIYLYDEIGKDWVDDMGTSSKEFVAALAELSGTELITVHINSPGGSVFDGVAIYNALENHPAAIEVAIDGIAASIASVIAMAGDTITISKGAMVMVHNPAHFLCGRFDSDEMKKHMTSLGKIATSMSSIYQERTGKSAEVINKYMDDETWFTAEQAVEAGFADSVGKEKKITAALTRDQVTAAQAIGAFKAHLSLVEKPTAGRGATSGLQATAVIDLCTKAGMAHTASAMIKEGLSEAGVTARLETYSAVENRLTAAGLDTKTLMANIENIPQLVGDALVAMAAKSTPAINGAIKPGVESPAAKALSSTEIYAKRRNLQSV